MSAIEPLYRLIGINRNRLSRKENIFLEAALFTRLCNELKENFRAQYRDYFRLMRFTMEQENVMLETNFASFIIKDILSTESYTLRGIAHYADTHEDVVHEVISGRNTDPSGTFLRKIIELHQVVRRDLYHAILRKIILE